MPSEMGNRLTIWPLWRAAPAPVGSAVMPSEMVNRLTIWPLWRSTWASVSGPPGVSVIRATHTERLVVVTAGGCCGSGVGRPRRGRRPGGGRRGRGAGPPRGAAVLGVERVELPLARDDGPDGRAARVHPRH